MAINVTGTIVPMGAFGSVIDTDIKGGFRIVDTLDDRDSIHEWRREWGMIIIVAENLKSYILVRGFNSYDITDNLNWREVELNIHLCDVLYELTPPTIQFTYKTDPFEDGSCEHLLELDESTLDDVTSSSEGTDIGIQIKFLDGAVNTALYQHVDVPNITGQYHGLHIVADGSATVDFSDMNSPQWSLSFFHKVITFTRSYDRNTDYHRTIFYISDSTSGTDSDCGENRIELSYSLYYNDIKHTLKASNLFLRQIHNDTCADITRIEVTQPCDLLQLGWVHYCLVKDGTSMKLYLNGLLVGESEDFLSTTNYDNVYFLTGYYYSSTSKSYPSTGGLCIVRLFNRPLDEQEVQQLAQEFIDNK